jgi:xanthine dehydrogenase molybdenum-binding subunit
MAAAIHVGVYGYDLTIVKLLQDGTAQVLSGACDSGMGGDTVIAMIVAETLKIAYDHVSIISADTGTTAWASPSVASRVTATTGNAAKLAAEDALRQLFEAAASILDVDPLDLDAADGEVFVKSTPATKLTFKEIMDTLTPPVIVAYGRWGVTSTDQSLQGFAAQYVDVEVDIDTGEVTVLNVVYAHDVGRAINKNTVEQQIVGGANGQGLGMAITEDCIMDEPTGVMLNPNFLDYAIPTTADLPNTECILVEPVDPVGPYGAKGCSEVCIVPTAAAVANAVYNATGARVKEYPLSPWNVLKALGKV